MNRWTSLEDALLPAVTDLFDAERQQLNVLPAVAGAVSRMDVRAVVHRHLDETRSHLARLERVLAMMGGRPGSVRCAGIAGILDEATVLFGQDCCETVRDAVIVGWMQRVEHYEITAYGTASAWADALELDEVAILLRETLAEEKDADDTLTIIADADVNAMATIRSRIVNTRARRRDADAEEPDAAA